MRWASTHSKRKHYVFVQQRKQAAAAFTHPFTEAWADSISQQRLRSKANKAGKTTICVPGRGWRNEAPWATWKDIRTGDQASYGQLLAAENFEGIKNLAESLYP